MGRDDSAGAIVPIPVTSSWKLRRRSLPGRRQHHDTRRHESTPLGCAFYSDANRGGRLQRRRPGSRGSRSRSDSPRPSPGCPKVTSPSRGSRVSASALGTVHKTDVLNHRALRIIIKEIKMSIKGTCMESIFVCGEEWEIRGTSQSKKTASTFLNSNKDYQNWMAKRSQSQAAPPVRAL